MFGAEIGSSGLKAKIRDNPGKSGGSVSMTEEPAIYKILRWAEQLTFRIVA